jgi:hypothetical protein
MATLDRNQLELWIAAYEAAWRAQGTAALPRLFSPEASYSTGPYQRAHLGLESISKLWEAERASEGETFELHAEILAIDHDTGVVRTAVHYEEPRQQEYRNLWVIRLDEEGRCVHFEEWPFSPEESGNGAAESSDDW